MRKTLYLKFLLAYLIFGFFGFIVVATFGSSMTQEHMKREKADSLYKEATLIANTYAADLYSNEVDLETVNTQMDSLSLYLDAVIWIINPSGRMILDTDSPIDVGTPRIVENFNATDFAGSYYTVGNFYESFDEDMLSVFAPITSNFKVSGYVVIHTSMEDLRVTSEGILSITYIILVILFLLSLIILIFFTEMVYLPLRKITEATEQYAAGNMHYEIQVDSEDEMGYLAATMSERYITDRYLPDKAIDLLDEACSNVNLKNRTLAREAEISKEMADLAKEKEVMMAADTEEAYARLANIRSMELRLEAEQQQLQQQGVPALTLEHLANVIELWTNIPASRIQEQEFERLSKLEDRLKEHIVGQDEAVHAVAAAIRRGRVGISPKRKPVSFIFVGSTGVGKTELVKQLAQDLFNAPESLIRLDMSEFMEKYAVSRIIGSPPGYVGYDEAGQLTEKIRRKPYSVVLFDEIEKAHPDVLNILLQILDDGHITDAHGRKVNFENTVIVMTSNAGSNTKVGSVGFNRTADEQGKDRAMKALQDFLRPEFINRVDEIVYFHQLTEDNFKAIAGLMLRELKDSLAERHISLTWEDSLLDYLVKKSYSAAYGARNLRRLIQKELEDAIAERIIGSWQHPVSQINVSSDGDSLILTTV